MSKRKAVGCVVPHTHWDREWRYPIWKNRMLLVEFMDQLLDILEKDAAYRCFVMDGQCVVIEDYLEVRPENAGRVRGAIAAGRLAIGPWYTLPDLYPLDGECLVRNLLKGIRVAKELGGHLGIGYNSFGWGQTAQFPQIYAGFGFDFVIAAKYVSKARAPRCEFWWEAPDGTRILASRLGKEARANGFFHAYIPVRFGMDYESDEYRFRWGKTGQVYHRANAEECHEDYFRVDRERGYHRKRIRGAFQAAWNAMDETLAPDYRLILDGSDFTTPQPILTRMISDANAVFDDKEFRLGTLEEYAAELRKRLKGKKVPVVKGELRDGPASHCSGNALATRIHIKQLNKRAENALIRRAEPLASLLTLMGEAYPASFLEIAWKHLLQAHPHDSINGVTQDKTVEDNLNRLSQALEIAEAVFERSVSRLIQRMDLSRFEPADQLLLIVNPLPHPAREILRISVDTPKEENVWDIGLAGPDSKPLDVQFVSREEKTCPVNDLEARPWPFHFDRHVVYVDPGEIPASGYKVLRVIPRKRFEREAEWWPEMRTSTGQDLARTAHTLENEFLKVEVQRDGTFSLTDRKSGRTIRNMHYFEDTGDAGDYWAYYPPYNNRTFLSIGGPARIWLEDNGPLSATIGVEILLEIPARAILPEKTVIGQSCRSEETRQLTITSRLTLRRGARRLDIRTRVQNTAEDHRLRVMIATDIRADHADSGGHFTVDRRPVIPPRDENGEFYPEMQTLPQQMFVDVSDGENGLAVVQNSLTEYQLLDDEPRTLALTLFRSVRNRICTEKRSTGHFPHQKGGQLLQALEFEYAVYPHAGDWSEGCVYAQALSLNAPPAAFQISPRKGGTLPLETSLFSVEPPDLIVSALKKAEDRDSIILRLFNPTGKTVDGRIRLHAPIRQAFLTNLNEERLEERPVVRKRRLDFTVDPNRIVTLEIIA